MLHLSMFNFCPSCASKKITFKEGKLFFCPDCEFTYYHNIAAATGCLIVVPDSNEAQERLVFLVRGKDPAAGKLDLPGGFVDIGEGALEGLYRELREEIGWAPVIPEGADLSGVFTLFASFSNIYQYKGFDYNTCDMYFTVQAPNLKPEHLNPEKDEVTAIRFLTANEIDLTDFAFSSTRKAVETYLKRK